MVDDVQPQIVPEMHGQSFRFSKLDWDHLLFYLDKVNFGSSWIRFFMFNTTSKIVIVIKFSLLPN